MQTNKSNVAQSEESTQIQSKFSEVYIDANKLRNVQQPSDKLLEFHCNQKWHYNLKYNFVIQGSLEY